MKPFSFAQLNPARTFCLFFILGVIAYGQTLFYPFVHDDVVFIVNNPHISNLNLSDIFQPKDIGPSSTGLVNVYYRPLIELFHRIQYQIFGLNPFGYHLTNVLIHILNAFLLSLLLGRFKGIGPNLAGICGLLFLVHPVQTEAVACISGISNLLLMFLMCSSFLAYLKANERKSNRWLWLSLVLFFTGCLVKEQMIVLPMLILMYEIFTGGRVKAAVSYFGTLILYFLIRKLILGNSLTMIFDSSGEHWLRFMAIPRSLLSYLSIIVFPQGLHYYRSLDVLQSNTLAGLFIFALVVIICAFLVRSRIQSKPILWFACGWFIVTLFPMLNIIPLVNEYSSLLNFEHFLYIPIVGALIFLCSFVHYIFSKYAIRESIYGLIVIGVIVLAMGLTIKQNTYWKSEIALFERTLKYQNSARVRILLAKAYYFASRYDRAILEYEEAFKMMSSYINLTDNAKVKDFYRGFIKEIYFDLAHCYEAKQNIPKAVEMYTTAIRLYPKNEILYSNLALLYIKQSDYLRAIDYLETALKINPASSLTRQNLAYCYFQIGQKDRADQLIEQGVKRP